MTPPLKVFAPDRMRNPTSEPAGVELTSSEFAPPDSPMAPEIVTFPGALPVTARPPAPPSISADAMAKSPAPASRSSGAAPENASTLPAAAVSVKVPVLSESSVSRFSKNGLPRSFVAVSAVEPEAVKRSASNGSPPKPGALPSSHFPFTLQLPLVVPLQISSAAADACKHKCQPAARSAARPANRQTLHRFAGLAKSGAGSRSRGLPCLIMSGFWG